MAIEVFARAKVNLALHVTGQRPDGYHLLDSLVTFPDIGDRLTLEIAKETSLSATGPFARMVPTDESNLIVRAANLLGVSARINLEKNLPVASGIGGGSADAAAAIEGLTSLYNIPLPTRDALLTLGADVPVCLQGGFLRMRGIGEDIEILSSHDLGWPMLLVNPGVEVSTPAVFKALERKDNSGLSEPRPSEIEDAFFGWLIAQRNDLEAPAIALCPEIGDVLSAIRAQTGCVVERMSGSGATCFGLFIHEDDAQAAEAAIRRAHPDWWVALGNVG